MSADQEVFDEGGPAEGLGEAWEEVPARWQCCFVAFSVDEPRAATRTSNPFAFAAAYLTLALSSSSSWQHLDETSNMNYYHNRETGETTWERYAVWGRRLCPPPSLSLQYPDSPGALSSAHSTLYWQASGFPG